MAYEEGGIEAAKQLARERDFLNDREQIRITLIIDDAANTAAVVDELENFGVFIEGAAADEINIAIPILLLERLNDEDRTTQDMFSELTQLEHVIRVRPPMTTQPRSFFLQQAIIGEGVPLTGADRWHATGLTGQGVRVGVLDLGFGGYRDLLGTELPANVTTRSFVPGVSDIDDTNVVHGTACAEIVHEMAPGAELFLAYYDGSFVSMSRAVDWLLEQNVQVISHSAGATFGPMDGTGNEAKLVDMIAEQGVLWINSTGNEAEAHYRGIFTDTDGDKFHEFPDGRQAMAVYAFAPFIKITLNWDDWEVVDQDYELLLYDEDFDLLASATNQQAGMAGDEPIEFIYYSDHPPESVLYVAIEAYDASRPVTFDMFVYPAEVAYPVPEHSLGTPADAFGSLSVGATEVRDDSLAVYSSQGPTNDGRIKPEISAPAGVSGASYGSFGFDGTSASTPHVAGAAALIFEANPDLTATDVQNFLITNAIDYGPPGPDTGFGYGRLNLPDPATTENPPTEAQPTEDQPVEDQPTPEPEIVDTPILVPTIIPTFGPPRPIESQPGGGEGLLATLSLLVVCTLTLICCGGLLLLGGAGLLFRGSRRKKHGNSAGKSQMSALVSGVASLLIGNRQVHVPPGGLRIGRAPDNNLTLDDNAASRYHANLMQAASGWMLRDLGSANGTFVNGERITLQRLNPGDHILIGKTEMQFKGR